MKHFTVVSTLAFMLLAVGCEPQNLSTTNHSSVKSSSIIANTDFSKIANQPNCSPPISLEQAKAELAKTSIGIKLTLFSELLDRIKLPIPVDLSELTPDNAIPFLDKQIETFLPRGKFKPEMLAPFMMGGPTAFAYGEGAIFAAGSVIEVIRFEYRLRANRKLYNEVFAPDAKTKCKDRALKIKLLVARIKADAQWAEYCNQIFQKKFDQLFDKYISYIGYAGMGPEAFSQDPKEKLKMEAGKRMYKAMGKAYTAPFDIFVSNMKTMGEQADDLLYYTKD